jgi:hypothetical protein
VAGHCPDRSRLGHNRPVNRVLEHCMGLPAEPLASHEDLFDQPETLAGEHLNGRIVTHPRPAPEHAIVYFLGVLWGD